MTLSAAQLAMAQTTNWQTGVLVTEVEQPRFTLGELRCYRDIRNGDNLESIFNLQAGDTSLYCIAYNVPAAPGSTPTSAPKPTPTPTPKPTPKPTPTPKPCPTPTPKPRSR